MWGCRCLLSPLSFTSDAPPLSPVVKARLMGLVVVAGSNTPGIYAMRWQSDVQDWDDQSAPGQALVRGTVWLWGDTIEHEYGVKGEFAYPGAITDVPLFRLSRMGAH